MKKLLDYDPIHGVSTFFYADGDQFRFTYERDPKLLEATIDLNKSRQNDEDKTKRGIKNDWWLYASIDPTIAFEWLTKHGVDIHNPAHRKRVFELCNSREYRNAVKATTKTHTVKE